MEVTDRDNVLRVELRYTWEQVEIGDLDRFYEEVGEDSDIDVYIDEYAEGYYVEADTDTDPSLSQALWQRVKATAKEHHAESEHLEYSEYVDGSFYHGGTATDFWSVLQLVFGTYASIWAFLKVTKPLLLKWKENCQGRSIKIKVDDLEILISGIDDFERVLTLISEKILPKTDSSSTELQNDIRVASSKTIKVLFIAANPTDTSRLRLDEEIRGIEQAIHQAAFRDRFDIEQHWAVRITDLQSCLLRHRPHIVHFSGHGSSSNEIILENSSGVSHPISTHSFSKLFLLLKDNIRCVVLNACNSEHQSQAIAQHIDCVVGMSKAIGDKTAISFAAAFYQALAYGRDVRTAFDLGCLQINLENLDAQDTPRLLAINVNPGEVFFV